MQNFGPERRSGQGLDAAQAQSGNRVICQLLTDAKLKEAVDLVITWRDDEDGGAYEVWAERGMVRFRRMLREGGATGTGAEFAFEVIEVVGENPVANQDTAALRSVALEALAAEASGFSGDDDALRFVAPEEQSYPFAYERIAQLFDSPHAPDLAISPRDWMQGPYAGNHGALHIRQARAPLWIAGPRVVAGEVEGAARSIDIAPTLLAALGFPLIDGKDASGRTSSERGTAPDVHLRRQDGRVLEELLDRSAKAPKRLYVFLLDGLHMTELQRRIAESPEEIPHLARLHARAARMRDGQVVNFPSITWPSHTTIGTGTWCGHHDVVNPSYYLREKRETVSPQGQQVKTEGFCSGDVESLHEAFHRVRPGSFTAAIYAPFGRGADHAALEGRNLAERSQLRRLTEICLEDVDPRWQADGFKSVIDESTLDARGTAQVIELFANDDHPKPEYVYHELALTDGAGHEYGPHAEGLRAALAESDRKIGRVLATLEGQGLLEETLFVVTADHGMAPQKRETQEDTIRELERDGVQCTICEPMLWLHDVAVEASRAGDGRTGRVIVTENDALPTGERPAVEGAQVIVSEEHWGERREITRGRTDAGGVYGFATPPSVATDKLVVEVAAAGFNPRELTLDGQPRALDLREALYGE